MFKNREYRIRSVKIDPKTNEGIDTLQEHSTIDPEKIGEITKDVMFTGHALTKDLVKHAAKAVGAVIVVSVVATTISDVIVNKSKQN